MSRRRSVRRQREGRSGSAARPLRSFFASRFSHFQKIFSSRPVGDVDAYTITASLGGTILHLSYIGHGAEQPYPQRHQHREEAKHHRVLDVAVALILRRLRRVLSSVRHLAIGG